MVELLQVGAVAGLGRVDVAEGGGDPRVEAVDAGLVQEALAQGESGEVLRGVAEPEQALFRREPLENREELEERLGAGLAVVRVEGEQGGRALRALSNITRLSAT